MACDLAGGRSSSPSRGRATCASGLSPARGSRSCVQTRHRAAGRGSPSPMWPARSPSLPTSARTARRRSPAFATGCRAASFRPNACRPGSTELGDGLAAVDVGGEPAYILSEDLDDLVATKAVADGATPRRLRPMGPRPRHRRPARHRHSQADRRQPPERLDRADRRRRWRGRGHLGARRRRGPGGLVQRSRETRRAAGSKPRSGASGRLSIGGSNSR